MRRLRFAFRVAGTAAAMLAIVFGLVLLAANLGQVFTSAEDSFEPWVLLLIIAAGLAAVAGGGLYILGQTRLEGRAGLVARAVGFVLFGAALLLPTTLSVFQLTALLLAAPGVFLGADRA